MQSQHPRSAAESELRIGPDAEYLLLAHSRREWEAIGAALVLRSGCVPYAAATARNAVRSRTRFRGPTRRLLAQRSQRPNSSLLHLRREIQHQRKCDRNKRHGDYNACDAADEAASPLPWRCREYVVEHLDGVRHDSFSVLRLHAGAPLQRHSGRFGGSERREARSEFGAYVLQRSRSSLFRVMMRLGLDGCPADLRPSVSAQLVHDGALACNQSLSSTVSSEL